MISISLIMFVYNTREHPLPGLPKRTVIIALSSHLFRDPINPMKKKYTHLVLLSQPFLGQYSNQLMQHSCCGLAIAKKLV